MSENIKLALKCGAAIGEVLEGGLYCMFLKEGSLAFTQAGLDAFAEAIRRKTLEETSDYVRQNLQLYAGDDIADRIYTLAQEGVTK